MYDVVIVGAGPAGSNRGNRWYFEFVYEKGQYKSNKIIGRIV